SSPGSGVLSQGEACLAICSTPVKPKPLPVSLLQHGDKVLRWSVQQQFPPTFTSVGMRRVEAAGLSPIAEDTQRVCRAMRPCSPPPPSGVDGADPQQQNLVFVMPRRGPQKRRPLLRLLLLLLLHRRLLQEHRILLILLIKEMNNRSSANDYYHGNRKFSQRELQAYLHQVCAKNFLALEQPQRRRRHRQPRRSAPADPRECRCAEGAPMKREDEIARYPMTKGRSERVECTPAELLYRAMLPSVPQYMIALLKPIEFSETQPDVNRHKEVIAKSVSGFLLLLLKHLKLSHVYQFEYIAQHLVFANCIPLILKFFNRTLLAMWQNSNRLSGFEFPECLFRPDDFELSEDFTSGTTGCSWRQHVHLLVPGQGAEQAREGKAKDSRTMMLVVLNTWAGSGAKSTMNLMSCIYEKVRHRLTDDWAFANDLDARPWDFQSEECSLRNAVDRFNHRRYGLGRPSLLPKATNRLDNNLSSVLSREVPLAPDFCRGGGYEMWLGRNNSSHRPHAKLGKYEHIVGAQKYPEIRQRGFYSDVVLETDPQALGDVMDGPERDPNHMWDLRTADHTPMVDTFEPPENLLEQITQQTDHGPTTKLTELSILQEKYKITTDQLVPKQSDEGNRPGTGEATSLLEVFDNTDYDWSTAAEWLAMGHGRRSSQASARTGAAASRDDQHDLDIRDPPLSGVGKWSGFLTTDPDSQLWLILPIFAIASRRSVCRTTTSGGTLRYHLYLDCMPSDGLGEADKNSFNRIDRMGQRHTEAWPGQGGELRLLAQHEKIIFNGTIVHHQDQYSYVTVPQSSEEPVPQRGCVDVPEYNFDEAYSLFAFHSLLTRQESINAIGWVRSECNEVAANRLFQVPLAKHMRLEEFEQDSSSRPLSTWLCTCATPSKRICAGIFELRCANSGKGWFDFEHGQILRLPRLQAEEVHGDGEVQYARLAALSGGRTR
uniref:DUF3402 domain-containing protein n=1 Tax=Macrostomum lignano TaxID=282301 RepID=A0A1I8JP78_9PLAT